MGIRLCISFFLIAIMAIYPYALKWMNIPDEAFSQGKTYAFICALGIPLIIGYNAVCAILRGIGDSKSPLIFVGVACTVNVVGDIVLTGILKMDVAGVAVSTVAAQGVSFITGIAFLKRKGIGLPLSLSDFRPKSETIGNILKLGIPLGVKSILVSLAMTVIASIINTLGLTASAAMGVGDKIVNFAFLPQTAFSNAICIVTAQNIGARKPERAKKAMLYGMATCLTVGIIFCLFCQLFPTVLPSLFTPDADVQKMCGAYIRAYSIDSILASIVFCMTGMFTGYGKSTFAMINDLSSMCIIRVPATYLISRIPNITLFHIGLAGPLSNVISVIVCVAYLKLGKWETIIIDKD